MRKTLVGLFAEVGPPLVLKHDGGSGFTCEKTGALLEEWGVTSLLSPPRTPSFNGSREASQRWTKKMIAHAACGPPTRGDLDVSLLLLNSTLRPRRLEGATPEEAWAIRPHIGHEERVEFQRTVAERRAMIDASSVVKPATARRRAVVEALVTHDLLRISRR